MSPPARRNLTPAEVAYYRGQEYLEEKGPVGRQKGVEGNADKMSAFSRTSEAIARRRIQLGDRKDGREKSVQNAHISGTRDAVASRHGVDPSTIHRDAFTTIRGSFLEAG